MEDKSISSNKTPTWQTCVHCPNLIFNTTTEFERHLLQKHSYKEGSIILCQYGQNGICSSLQFGDLRKAGFRYHVREYHLYSEGTSDKWTFYSSSQNLPAVLNDPNRGKQSNFFTKTWGDYFIDKVEIYPSPYIPEIKLAHFESYCKKISKRYKRHYRLKDNVNSKPKTPVIENDCEVPKIFFEPNLSLNQPEVFTEVFPNLVLNDSGKSLKAIQESLSTYLDVIEIRISKQVAEKSEEFFNAMLSHDTIMEQMAAAVKTVRQTRQNLKEIKDNLTENSRKIVKLTRTTQNLTKVHETLKLMSTVQQTQPMIQLLLSTSDYVAALDLISSTQNVLTTRLSGVQAFRHLSPQLTEMKRLIHKMLSNELQKFILTDLNRPPVDESELPERDQLMSIVSGILRLKELDFVDTFKVEAMTTIQTTIKQCVVEIVSEREGHSEIVLRGNSDGMWLMCNEGIVFLERVTPKLLIVFKRIMSISNLILEVSQMDEVAGLEGDDSWSKEDIEAVEAKLKKMTTSLSDYCNERCANLIVTKSDKDYGFNDLSQLSHLTKLIETFACECEAITKHNSNAMTLALRSFAMKFIQSLHNDRRIQLTNSLNSERWKSTTVPCELQSVVDKICEIGEIPDQIVFKNEKKDNQYLIINKENYAVVSTVQLLVKILLEYCDATRQSPIIVQYVVHCMLELIRHFNSRCCQLVLGAGAIQSAGLKTITTSNLALVFRSLQVILWLLPMIKKLLDKLNTKDISLSGFVTLQNDINSHKQEIENKICIIVTNLLTSQLTGWEAKPPVPSQTFRSISKHLVKLHEALIDILTTEEIRTIYKRVHENFKDKLREQLLKMNIVANGTPQHGVVTSELTFYLQTLKTLRLIRENDPENNILYEVWLN